MLKIVTQKAAIIMHRHNINTQTTASAWESGTSPKKFEVCLLCTPAGSREQSCEKHSFRQKSVASLQGAIHLAALKNLYPKTVFVKITDFETWEPFFRILWKACE